MSKLTTKEVRDKVWDIGQKAGDFEAAHSDEDDLYEEVLKAIVAGHDDPVELAKAALLTKKINFARHCA